MEFSIIIPAYNVASTIKLCIESILDSYHKNIEIIIVNDGSTDNTYKIAKNYPCKIINHKKNIGLSSARKTGLKYASYKSIVFIDADILIQKDTLNKFVEKFKKKPDIDIIVCTLTKNIPVDNFLSQYKNLYMYYTLNKCPEYVDFIYGSCFAIRDKDLLFYPHDVPHYAGEDTHWGTHLNEKKRKIFLDKENQVIHLKKYSPKKFIINEFIIPWSWSKLFIKKNKFSNILKNKRFYHANSEQLISLLIAPFIILSIFVEPYLAFFLFFLLLYINLNFFIFLYKEKGILFTTKSIVITFIDNLIKFFAVVAGLFYHFMEFKISGSKEK